jgi:hypothetical protein
MRCLSENGLARAQRVQYRGLASLKQPASLFSPLDTFHERHIGPDDMEAAKMLRRLGYMKMNTFIGTPFLLTSPSPHTTSTCQR